VRYAGCAGLHLVEQGVEGVDLAPQRGHACGDLVVVDQAARDQTERDLPRQPSPTSAKIA